MIKSLPPGHIARMLAVASIYIQSVLLCLLVSAATHAQPLNLAAIEAAEIMNLAPPRENTLASGQPTREQLQVLAESGVKHIISLRPAEELDWDEASLVESLGMEYHSIPVAGVTGLNNENAQSLDTLLETLNGQPLLVHCGTSNRVGALRALTANAKQHSSLESSIAEGKNWGLERLEPVVRGLLESE